MLQNWPIHKQNFANDKGSVICQMGPNCDPCLWHIPLPPFKYPPGIWVHSCEVWYFHWLLSMAAICRMPADIERDTRTPILSRVMALSAMELQLGHSGFCRPHTQKRKQNASMIFVCVWGFTHVYLHVQPTVHAQLTNHGYFDCGEKLE